MSKVEDNENPVTGEPVYPVGYVNQWRDDEEIDLVDLWIVMWSYRKLFISAVILIAVVGILCFELFYNSKPTSTVRSLIQIERVTDGNSRVLVVAPDVLIKRIEVAMLPRFSSLGEFAQIKPFIMATRASSISIGSTIVEIVSNMPAGDVTVLSRFHEQLVDNILLELKKSAVLVTADVRDTLFSVKSRIVNLEGVIITLEQDLLNRDNSQDTSNHLLQDEIALRKANLQSEIDILTERAESLELTLANTGSLVLLKAGVSEKSSGLAKPVAYSLIIVGSLLLALILTMCVIFARKVKQRMATGG